MIDAEQIRRNILAAMPDAEVRIEDLTGTADHYQVQVVSRAFAGLSALERHRKVYAALRGAIDGGSLHALALGTATPDEAH